MKELAHVRPERTPEDLPFALAPVAYVRLVVVLAVLPLLERMKRLATRAELLTFFRSTAAPVTGACVSRDDKAFAHGHLHNAFTGRLSGHVRRPIVAQCFPPRVPLLCSGQQSKVQPLASQASIARHHGLRVGSYLLPYGRSSRACTDYLDGSSAHHHARRSRGACSACRDLGACAPPGPCHSGGSFLPELCACTSGPVLRALVRAEHSLSASLSAQR